MTTITDRPVTRRPSRRRVERTDQTRRDIFAAAGEVVGEVGYEAASITLITQVAGVADGTFCNAFASRQDSFDQLLPAVGTRLLDRITAAVEQAPSGLPRERQRFRACFRFFEENPGFLRILNEAVVFAPPSAGPAAATPGSFGPMRLAFDGGADVMQNASLFRIRRKGLLASPFG